jgi:hypothetical protein
MRCTFLAPPIIIKYLRPYQIRARTILLNIFRSDMAPGIPTDRCQSCISPLCAPLRLDREIDANLVRFPVATVLAVEEVVRGFAVVAAAVTAGGLQGLGGSADHWAVAVVGLVDAVDCVAGEGEEEEGGYEDCAGYWEAHFRLISVEVAWAFLKICFN